MISGSGLAIANIIGFCAILLIISSEKAPFLESPYNTSAPLTASARVLHELSVANFSLYLFMPFSLPLYITPFVSHNIRFSFFTPRFTINCAIASPDAPAPFITTLTSFIFLLAAFNAFNKAAPPTIAGPCWSSWKTGISSVSFKRCSISKQRGALISSRFIPPKPGAR